MKEKTLKEPFKTIKIIEVIYEEMPNPAVKNENEAAKKAALKCICAASLIFGIENIISCFQEPDPINFKRGATAIAAAILLYRHLNNYDEFTDKKRKEIEKK